MTNKTFRPLVLTLFCLMLLLGASSSAFGQATIVILNNDAANFGFNDTTAAAPVGGNPGTTLGQQRLNAFQAAADKWGATLTSPITITIRAQWAAQTCTATSAVLGSAGAIGIFRDFPGFPFAGTWYNESLGSKLFGSDLNATQPEINATFNINLGQPGCLTGTFFYLGLDGNHGTNIDLVTVLEHEFGHGLGFQTFSNAQTGAYNSGFPSIYDRFLMDNSSGKSWLNMTNAERAASSINTHNLAWNGPQVQADVPSVLALGVPVVTVNSPPGIAGDYRDVAASSYGPVPPVGGVTANLLLANDGTAPVTDGCEPFPAGFFTGQIAVIDRGTCSFKTKTLNAQNAGAVGVIIVNNVAGTPAPALGEDATITTPITIPTVSLTQTDGNLVKAQLGGGVNATIRLDPNTRAGADLFGKALLYTPNPFSSGSSVSHWDTFAFPNQLMEPNINGDLTHEVTPPQDLTFSQLRDIGWVASAIPTAISKTGGDNQNTALNQPYSTPLSVTVSPAIAGITVTWTANAGGSGANGSFSGTGRSAISVTNASGVATAPTLTANGTSGFFSVNATAPGAGTTTFSVLIDPAPVAGPACVTDTTQADFAAGTTNNTDVNASPGNVVLLNPANADQTQTVASTSGTGFNTTQWLGQTFVPGVTGNLARIDMALFCASCSGTDQPITVEVRTTTGSPALPTSTVLATTTIPGFNSGASSTFTATFASPPALTAGTTYAYTLRLVTNRTGTYAAVFGNAPTDYANGNRVVSTNSGGTWTVPTSTGTARDLVFTTYMQTGNAPSGDFTSSLKDSNPPVAGTTQWGTLSWNATVPAGTTLQFQAAASNNFGGPFNFVGPDSTAGTFFTNGASLSQFNGFRYLKYKAFFTTSNGTLTPSLADVTICYQNPVFNTSTTVTSNNNPSAGGEPVTFTATVTSGTGIPTGTVNFKDGASIIGSGTLNGSGQATYTTSSLSQGSHSITAEYLGSTGHNPSTSPAITQVVTEPLSTCPNVAEDVYGSTATASSTFSPGYAASGAIDGNHTGAGWGTGVGWNDNTAGTFPDTLTINLGTSRQLDEIDVYSLQDNHLNPSEPTESMTFTLYGLVDFQVQYWNGAAFVDVPGGNITGNNKVRRRVIFASPVTTDQIRIVVNNTSDIWSRVVEVEAFSCNAGPAPTPTPTPTPCGTNVGAASYGGTATASSTINANYPASGVIDGNRAATNWGTGTGWNDATAGAYPDSVVLNFGVNQSISEVDVYSLQDNYTSPVEPTDVMTFTYYGLTDFQVQIPDGVGGWLDVPGGHVTGNNLVKRKVVFAPVVTSQIRVLVNSTADGVYSRIAEVEALSCSAVPGPTPTPTPTPCTNNVAAASAGATAAASSVAAPGYAASGAIDGNHTGAGWGTGVGWNDGTAGAYPDNLVVTFSGTQSITEVDVYSLQDNYTSPVEPTDSTTFTAYGLTNFQVQVPDGIGGWVDVPGGNIVGNNLVKRKVIFASPVSTNQIRILVTASADGVYSRIVEVEAFTCGGSAPQSLRTGSPGVASPWEQETSGLLQRLSEPMRALMVSLNRP